MGIDISVIVPVYKTDKYLRDCVDSIIAQTIFESLEIILVDDGSPDNSPKICDKYALAYKNIFVIHQKNSGVSVARNEGIKKAVGKYIGFVDSDDYIFPEMYERLFKSAEKTNADICFCGFKYRYPEDETDIFYPFSENIVLDEEYIKTRICTFLMKDESFNACWNKLFCRRLIYEKLLEFEVGRKIGEDRRFTIDFLSNCSSACYVSYIGYYYRLINSGAIQTPRKDYADNIIAQYHEDFELFEAIGINRKYIEEYSGMKLLTQSIAGISFAENKLRGKERSEVIKEIINNDEIYNCLKRNWAGLILRSTRYEKVLFFNMKIKSVFGLRLMMSIMQAKISLVRCKTQ